MIEPLTITEHPRVPGLVLRAGETLRKGEFCWIDEDGRVYRVRATPRTPVEGLATGAYVPGDAVTLYTQADWLGQRGMP